MNIKPIKKTTGSKMIVKNIAPVQNAVENTKKKKGEAPKITNPFLNRKQKYVDNFQQMAVSKLWAIIFGVSCGIIMLGSIASAINTANHSKYIPYVLAVNEHGVAIASGFAHEVTKVDDKIQISLISQFITNMRTITPDTALLRRNIIDAYQHVIQETPAYEKVNEHFAGNSEHKTPFERSVNELVSIEITAVVKQSDFSYQIDWIETTRDHKGTRLGPSINMRAIVTWGFGPQKTDQMGIIYNPLSLYIKDFNWNRIN